MGNQMQTEETGKETAGQQGSGQPLKTAATPAGPNVGKANTPPMKKRSVQEVVADWAADLTPANSPDPAFMGPLAWVRNCKVQELVAALAKEGIK